MPIAFGDNLYTLTVRDERAVDGYSTEGTISTGCYVFVYDAGTKTLSTLYADTARTSLANPITRTQFATDGIIKFYIAASSVDIVVAHSDGSMARYASVTPQTHMLILERGGLHKNLVVPFAANTTETDTGIDLPRFVLVKPPIVEVVTNESGKTIDVGLLSSETSGDADGFLVATSIAAVGFIRPYVITVGSNETYVNTTKIGALIGAATTGTDAANDVGQTGGYGHIITASTAVSVVYTCSSGTASAAGYIHIPFMHLR